MRSRFTTDFDKEERKMKNEFTSLACMGVLLQLFFVAVIVIILLAGLAGAIWILRINGLLPAFGFWLF